MTSQFRILWREFLFRTVDTELLSSQGDPAKLPGQIAMLLMLFSFWLSTDAYHYALPRVPHELQLIRAWPEEHFLIATTMLVTGLLAVLSWDSTFPDRRDILVLAPLPVRVRTIYLARIAALATALAVSTGVLHSFTGIIWPCVALTPTSSRPFEILFTVQFYRSLAAYWITMFSAALFIFCSVLSVQGLAAMLPRRLFMRLSALLQICAFCLFVTVYFLDPRLGTPEALSDPGNREVLAWLPSWWFLGLLQELNGSGQPAFASLPSRAIAGTVIAIAGAAMTFLWSGLRTFRKTVEEPDIAPGYRGARWFLSLGHSMPTAILLFSIRTLLRSRKHRVILAFYLAVAFSIMLPTLRALPFWHRPSVPLMLASVLTMCFAVVGIRVVFAMPLYLKANWLFQTTAVRSVPDYLAAARRAMVIMAVVPVWLASAVLYLWMWPLRDAVGHLIVLALFTSTMTDVCMYRFEKVPFTCSYMPGQGNIYRGFLLGFLFIVMLIQGIVFELRALNDPVAYGRMILVLSAAALSAWLLRHVRARSNQTVLVFEEVLPEQYVTLGIFRNGARLAPE